MRSTPRWTFRPARRGADLLRRIWSLVEQQLRQRPLLMLGGGAAALLTGYFALVWQAPHLVAGDQLNQITDPSARMSAEYNSRVLVVSSAGAVIVLIGLAYTARTYALNRRGQMTDRFTKALERLGSPEMYIRIGGIHALEHVMADSPEHHADCIEILVAYLRHRISRSEHHEYQLARETHTAPVDIGRWMHPPTDHRPPLQAPPPDLPSEPDPDVQAALTAIGRRPHRPNRERGQINLRELHLPQANLRGANLAGANLSRTLLRYADLTGANLTGADLRHARLRRAHLTDAVLTKAQLSSAELVKVSLWRARLTGANLKRADLDHADLTGADLTGAFLEHAILAGATLSDANLTRANLASANLRGAGLSGATLSGATLGGADLTGANLDTATGTEIWGLKTAIGPFGQPGELADQPGHT